jgi:hypothetical protein
MTTTLDTSAPAPATPEAPTPPHPVTRVVLTWIGVVAGVGMVLLTGLGTAAQVAAHSTSHSYAYPLAGEAPAVTLTADNDITVSVDPSADSVQVRVNARYGFSDEPALTSTSGENGLAVTYQCPRNAFVGVCDAHMTVVLPPRVGLLTLRSDTGRVDVSGVGTGLDARSTDGRLQIHDIVGDVLATSATGRIDVSAVTGNAEVRSTDGAVTVADVTGSATVKTATGRIDAARIGGDITATSTDGAVVIDTVHGNIETRTHTGKITVYGTTTPVDLAISSQTGRKTIQGATDRSAHVWVTIESVDGAVSYLGSRG